MLETAQTPRPDPSRKRRRRREEWNQQCILVGLLTTYLDPSVFWTGIENKPRSAMAGVFARRAGVKRGLPDIMALDGGKVVCVELKSSVGLPTRAQREIGAALIKSGAVWWWARSARSALAALHRSGITFARPYREPNLRGWEGPFDGGEKRVPSHPDMLRQQAAYNAKRRQLRGAERERRELERWWRERAAAE